MIRLKRVIAEVGFMKLVFDADFPDGAVKEVIVDYDDVAERLRALRELKGSVSLDDLKSVIRKIINDLRAGRTPLPEKFDFTRFVGADFEE